MKGMLCAAIPGHPEIETIAAHFSLDPKRLNHILDWMRHLEHPELLLLQNPDPDAPVRAVVFMTSTHSRSYWKSGSPSHTHIWRDFYYQCLFCGMGLLSEIGCTLLKIDNPALEDDGSYLLEIPYADDRELTMDILKYGPDVEVLAPTSLRRRVQDLLLQASQHYA